MSGILIAASIYTDVLSISTIDALISKVSLRPASFAFCHVSRWAPLASVYDPVNTKVQEKYDTLTMDVSKAMK